MSEPWELRRFGDTCDFVRGPFGGSLKKNIFKEEGYAVYEQQHAIYDQFENIRYFIDKEKFTEMARFELNSGDLIMSCSGTMGKIAIVPDGVPKGIINQALLKLTPKSSLLPKFLKLWMESRNFQEQIENLSQGAAIKNMASVKILKKIQVPTPEIPEQKRIVAILDQAFADIEQARAKTEQNLKNARELFESYLQQVFSQRGEGWEIKKVSEIAETCLGKMLDKKKNKGKPKPYIRNLNVQWFEINRSDLLEMRFEDSEYERYAIKKGDLVICEGGYPGRGAIWDQNEDIFFQKALHRIRCNKKIYNSWILYFLFLSDCNGSLKNSFTGAGIQHFTGRALKQLSLPIPKENVAKQYIEKIDHLFDRVRLLENVYQRKLQKLDELKKSILQKAFSGELSNTNNEGAAA